MGVRGGVGVFHLLIWARDRYDGLEMIPVPPAFFDRLGIRQVPYQITGACINLPPDRLVGDRGFLYP